MVIDAPVKTSAPALTPIVREISADLETPTSAYLKLRRGGPSFLLESVEGGEQVARYSFIGVEPRCVYTLRGRTLERSENGETEILTAPPDSDPFRMLEEEMSRLGTPVLPESPVKLPRFLGGLVGYLGFECVRYFEPRLDPLLHPSPLPEAVFLLADTIVAFDHVRRSMFLIAYPFDGEKEARKKLNTLEKRLRKPLAAEPARAPGAAAPVEFESNVGRERYEKMVRLSKEHIYAGDVFQVLPSQRLSRVTRAAPFDIYRALRRLNPSPYMFFFDFGSVDGEPFYLAGSSPEVFVRLEGTKASLRPIAGTSPRGATPEEDLAIEARLLADPKERAEHVMLVDLGRNDLGRVCRYGTINVPEYAVIERYSHVMHIVSQVEGEMQPGQNRVRPGARLVPGRDRQRRAEGAGDGDHLRARAGRARAVRRRGRIFFLRRFDGHLPRHPHADRPRQERLGPGRRRDRRGFRSAARIPGNDEQSPRGTHGRGAGRTVLIPTPRLCSGRPPE